MNSKAVRPVVSFKIDRNTLSEFDKVCGEIERTRAITNMIKYFTLPYNRYAATQIIRLKDF